MDTFSQLYEQYWALPDVDLDNIEATESDLLDLYDKAIAVIEQAGFEGVGSYFDCELFTHKRTGLALRLEYIGFGLTLCTPDQTKIIAAANDLEPIFDLLAAKQTTFQQHTV